MIAQFKSILKVGKFVAFSATSGNQYELGKRSIILGRNTFGKSTLSAIVKSLSLGNSDFNIGRKTFGTSDGQKVVIKETTDSGDQVHIFENGAWRGSIYSSSLERVST